MQIEMAIIFVVKPFVGSFMAVFFIELVIDFVESKQLGMGFVHFGNETANILCSHIGVAIDGGICYCLLIYKIVDKIGVAELLCREAVQLCKLFAACIHFAIEGCGKISIQLNIDIHILLLLCINPSDCLCKIHCDAVHF